MIQKIISGGQTGVDRAALDWALANSADLGLPVTFPSFFHTWNPSVSQCRRCQ
ncbi:MAG TPA: putative molybdenum carrier protein [Nitrosospira sp.]|nr:putative molybdenum carrier protein [Nitrosospira sp.]